VQCLLTFPIVLCVFAGTAYLIFYGTNSALLASTIIIFFSHNITASLRCYNVDHFILVVAILRYYYKIVLNAIIKKISMVGTCKP